MKRKLLMALAGCAILVAGIAFALPVEKVDITSLRPQWFKAGLYVSRTQEPAKKNKITKILANTGIYDFPALGSTELALPCDTSSAITVTGAGFGDTCSVGIDQALVNDALFSCFVSAANAVKVKMCAFQTDGGSVDMPDASYTVRVISSQ